MGKSEGDLRKSIPSSVQTTRKLVRNNPGTTKTQACHERVLPLCGLKVCQARKSPLLQNQNLKARVEITAQLVVDRNFGENCFFA
uniref:Uncharacterized protein n=1 Tax=Neolamprologus brichardi TaxID=32507 RepID=A0A3Q4HNR5_NEOBR